MRFCACASQSDKFFSVCGPRHRAAARRTDKSQSASQKQRVRMRRARRCGRLRKHAPRIGAIARGCCITRPRCACQPRRTQRVALHRNTDLRRASERAQGKLARIADEVFDIAARRRSAHRRAPCPAVGPGVVAFRRGLSEAACQSGLAEAAYSKLPIESWARLSKRVYSPKNLSFSEPVGPERCLPMMTSARPLSGEVSLL